MLAERPESRANSLKLLKLSYFGRQTEVQKNLLLNQIDFRIVYTMTN